MTTDTPRDAAAGHALGPQAAAIVSAEHWSLLSARGALLNEAQQRTSVFLTVLSAAMVASAFLADATGFSARAATLTIVVLTVALFLGVTTFLRLVQINRDEKLTVLAMNRLRHAYLRLEPGLRPYFSASPYDDRLGLEISYSLGPLTAATGKNHFLVTTPTVVATIDAALAAAIAVLATAQGTTAPAALVAVGVVVLGLVWAGLFAVQRNGTDPLVGAVPRFPTPPPPPPPPA
ncbi:hypothetical protein [Jiangella mangrovi]|uniref:Membrane protein implicated in regulation of membrane protease activity n=1 Tax=Jiangella mangrovi TaxID=1524084 RepID=A0A7W9GXF4_9ACTN|nr:hypothetical protein [Jiangella mangrovi]MBB5791794.1 membrane protein implicated in regulation of membrane protease activity [Jiangella mangrovi]